VGVALGGFGLERLDAARHDSGPRSHRPGT
jgi:hypothetical protein